MRIDIVHPGADKLRYEIREIVEVANRIAALGTSIVWENIGDPVAKGEAVPEWIRNIVGEAVRENHSYAYSPTKGVAETRAYIAKERNLEGGIKITPDDILFFNGLGDAITKIYSNLHPRARVIGPNPAYPTHSSAEAAHAGAPHLTYRLDPERGWEPDLDDLEQKIKTHRDIAGIIIINPDNPTGFVYPQATIRRIVAIARRYQLFLISDEIYSNLAYEGSGMQKLASVIGDVPGIAMRGISKEFPWPGARAGWVEFYNRDKNAVFDRYARSLLHAKMLEVCSTTLPQQVLPQVMSDSRYYPYLAERTARYARRSARATAAFGAVPKLIAHPAHGAFYQTVVFKKDALNDRQTLSLSPEAAALIEPHIAHATFDQRFVYYLLAATGVCVVPLSVGFNSDRDGFRMTLLEPDEAQFDKTITTIVSAARTYLASNN
ncbi:MAG: aminotransferase [Parcubacteria group bacterium 21-54-25]|nr:MAG: aminotransferase [Parcubacteria group bacterium 21-54-25]HQU08075.1 pyridoxal phosphate-dependent aminotransferase [Candidatus Paceibacterota bacterium]